MLSLRRGPVARRLRILTEHTRREVERRLRVRENAAALASIRAALAAAGIDPAGNFGLSYWRDSDRRLAGLADTPERQRAEAAFIAEEPELAARRSLAAEGAERAQRFAGQPPPAPGKGSPLDWYGWSLAARNTRSATAEAGVSPGGRDPPH